MSSRVLISTIISTYKRPGQLLQALDSLRAQHYRPLEILVVDDGSPDETRQAVERWRAQAAAEDGLQLRYVRQENQGPAAGRNRGIAMARGDYVQFMDDDDILDEQALVRLYEALQGRSGAVASMASYRQFREGEPMDAAPLEQQRAGCDAAERLGMMIRGDWFVPVHGYLFSRAALERIGLWCTHLTSQEDDEFLLRAALADVRFVSAPQALIYYCHHDRERRSVPGGPAKESVEKGTVARLFADLAIREQVFQELRLRGGAQRYREDFTAWQARLCSRYAPQMRGADFSDHAVMRWLAQFSGVVAADLEPSPAQRPNPAEVSCALSV